MIRQIRQIRHIVLLKVKDGTPADQVSALAAGLAGLKDEIPELVSLSLGENLGGDPAYTHALVAVVEDPAALARYAAHPAHQRVVRELVAPIVERRAVVDYAFDPQTEPWRPLVKDVWTALADVVRPEHTALLVIDIQNDFCAPGGARMKGDLSTIEALREPARRIVEAARRAGVPVLFTRVQTDAEHDTGPILARRARVGLGGTTYVQPGAWGWEVCDFLAPLPGETIIDKWHHSAFTNPALDATLRRLGIKTLLFSGVATNGCVEGTVRDAFARGYYAVVLEDCVGAYDLDLQRHSLQNMATHFARISSSADVLAAWSAVPAAAP